MLEIVLKYKEKFNERKKERRFNDDKQIEALYNQTEALLKKDMSNHKSHFKNIMDDFKEPYVFSQTLNKSFHYLWEESTGAGQRANLHKSYLSFLENLRNTNWKETIKNLDDFIFNYDRCIYNDYLDHLFSYIEDEKKNEIEYHCELFRELSEQLKSYG